MGSSKCNPNAACPSQSATFIMSVFALHSAALYITSLDHLPTKRLKALVAPAGYYTLYCPRPQPKSTNQRDAHCQTDPR